MSQAGIINVIETNPTIPIYFDADTGVAVALFNVINIFGSGGITTSASGNTITIDGSGAGPALTITGNSGGPLSPTANNWNIFGSAVAAGSTPVTTSGSVSTLTVNVQRAQAISSTDVTKVGLASFDINSFDVDSNGFVQLNGGGIATTAFDVQANTAPGTDPVLPTSSGVVTVNGAAVANHSVVLETRSRAANAFNLEVQYAAAAASTDATKSGVAHFDSSSFSVDANGFVTLSGGSEAIDSIGVDATSGGGTNPVLPTAGGLVTVNGARVAAGTNPIRTVSTAANVYQVQVQTSQALAATDATKVGLSNFNSAGFGVDANGFVSQATSVAQLFTANTGTATPSSNNLNVLGGGGIQTAGSGATLTVAVSGGGFTWTDVTGSTQTIAVQNGYLTDNAGGVTYTLPATASIGDTFMIVGKLGLATITPNANQQLLMGSLSGAVGATGTAVATNVGDSVTFVCSTSGASTKWRASSWVGTWILTP